MFPAYPLTFCETWGKSLNPSLCLSSPSCGIEIMPVVPGVCNVGLLCCEQAPVFVISLLNGAL